MLRVFSLWSRGPSSCLVRPSVVQVQVAAFSEVRSSFQNRAAGKAQLKEFYKFTHPDIFANAPKEVKDVNAESVQSLNAYLQSVQSLNTKVDTVTMKFYISRKALVNAVSKDDQSSQDKTPQTVKDFQSFEIELPALRNESSYTLRQQHYTNCISSLVDSLYKLIDQAEQSLGGSGSLADESLRDIKQAFQSNWDSTVTRDDIFSEQAMLKQVERDQKWRELQAESKHSQVHELIRNKVTANLYRDRYDIPHDLIVRKADADITHATRNSETIDQVKFLSEASIHPSLIFFENGLSDVHKQVTMRKLHCRSGNEFKRQHKDLVILKEISQRLSQARPQICLIFSSKKDFDHKKMPGFIRVPAGKFTANSLKEYVNQNLTECQIVAKKFTDDSQLQSKIQAALARKKQEKEQARKFTKHQF